jgi:sigma-B regulation protein RsbQ
MAANYQTWATGYAGLVMGNADRPALARARTRTLRSLRPDIAPAMARVVFESDERSELPRLTVPAVLVQSMADSVVPPEVTVYLIRHLAQARLVSISAEGHFPHLSAPDTIADIIQEVARSL